MTSHHVTLYPASHGAMCTSKSSGAASSWWVTPASIPSLPTPADLTYTQQRLANLGLGILQKSPNEARRSQGASSSCSPGSTHNRMVQDDHSWVPVKAKQRCPTGRERRPSATEQGQGKGHPAVRALVAMGYSKSVVKRAEESLRSQGQTLTIDTLWDAVMKLQDGGAKTDDVSSDNDDEDADGRHRPVTSSDTRQSESPPELHSDSGVSDSSEDIYSAGGAAASTSLQNASGPARQEANDDETSGDTEPSATSRKDDAKPQEKSSPVVINPALKKMLAENERLKKSTRCKICLDADVTILFLPCRHLVCCRACADNVSHCPVCREQILGTVKTYLP